jgi:ribokinase
LINLGSLCIDHVYRVPGLAGAGETVASLSHTVYPGGKGLNQSLAAASAGAQVLQFGCVGRDGGLLLQTLEAAGVDVEGVRTLPDATSGHAMIQVDDLGRNAIIISGGANRLLTRTDLQSAFATLNPGDWLLLQNEINDLDSILEMAMGSPAKVAFNVAPVDGREQSYPLDAVDLLIVNEIEARALLGDGWEAADEADEQDMAVALARRHPAADVVLTAGRSGLVHAAGDRCHRLPAFPVKAIDETAAGDAFIGYLLAGLLEGLPMTEALRSGSAAGALAVTVSGAASSIPDQEAVRELLSEASDQ